jgi:hypothetical protein
MKCVCVCVGGINYGPRNMLVYFMCLFCILILKPLALAFSKGNKISSACNHVVLELYIKL